MMHYRYRISWIVFLGLACLPLTRLFSLAWPELLRLLILTLGLLYVLIRIEVAERTSSVEKVPFLNTAILSIVLALMYIFIIFQFDPATSSLTERIPSVRGNWFFLSSTGLVLAAAGAALVQRLSRSKRRTSKKKRSKPDITSSDKIAIMICLGSVALSLISQSVFRIERGNWRTFIGAVKMIECLVLWFVVTRTASVLGHDIASAPVSRQRVHPLLRWHLRIVCLVFLIVVVAGGFQTGLVVNSYRRGHAFYERDELDKAKSKYRKAQHLNRFLRIKRIRDGCTDKLAVIYLQQDSTENAENILSALREGGDDSPSVFRRIGDIYFETEKWTEASTSYYLSLGSEKERERVFDNLAWCLVQLNNIQGLSRLVSSYEHDVSLVPSDYRSANVIGRYFLLNDVYEDALRSFQQSERFDPDNFESYFWIGQTLHILQRWPESIDYLEKVVQMKPDFGEAYYLIGSAHEMMDRSEEAVRWYEAAVEYHPAHSSALIALEQHYLDKGMVREAQEMRHREHIIFGSEMEGADHPFDKGEVWMWTNFRVSDRCRFLNGRITVYIIAKAASLFQIEADEIPDFDPSAHMVIRLDDVILGEADVPLGEWTTHPFEAYADSGQSTLTIAFTNDIYDPEQKMDRNLVIDKIIIHNERL
jgi:tetratricopeptide (TPR) repeat protein